MTDLCAYCNEEESLTREHIVPNCIYKKLNLKSNNSRFLAYDSTIDKSSKKEMFIKDVCEVCNNEKLSELDNHFSNIIDDILFTNETKIIFKYNYELLLRWLLKTIFNTSRFINADSKSDIYKKCFSSYILHGNSLDVSNTLIFGCPLNDSSFSSSFISIGTLALPNEKFMNYLNIFDFIQIKDFVFFIVSFDNNKSLKKHSKKVYKYLKQNFNASILNIDGKHEIDYSKGRELSRYIFNANEDGTTIPFKIFCKLQWNLDEKTPSIENIIANKFATPFAINALKQRQKKNDKLEKVIYTTEKNFLVTTDEISFLIYNEMDIKGNRSLHTGDWSIDDSENVIEFNTASAKVIRNKNSTVINIYDKNDLKNPYIKNLRTDQKQERWELFKDNIEKKDFYLYVSSTKSKSIQKQLENNSFKTLTFISKIKVTEIS